MKLEWVLLAITIVQIVQIVGRWTGKIDVNSIRNIDEIKRIKDTQYKFIQWQQEITGRLGILETDVKWIKKSIDK